MGCTVQFVPLKIVDKAPKLFVCFLPALFWCSISTISPLVFAKGLSFCHHTLLVRFLHLTEVPVHICFLLQYGMFFLCKSFAQVFAITEWLIDMNMLESN